MSCLKMKTNKKRLLVSQCWDNKSIYKISCQVFYFNIEITKLSSCYNKEHPVKFQAQHVAHSFPTPLPQLKTFNWHLAGQGFETQLWPLLWSIVLLGAQALLIVTFLHVLHCPPNMLHTLPDLSCSSVAHQ